MIIIKLIKGAEITRKDIEQELYEICDNEHSGCNPNCPVYAVHGSIPWTEDLRNCQVFKNGSKMYEFLKERKELL